jgi:hypothetical protein
MATIIDQEFVWHDGFKKNELHLVCVATGGLSTCDCAASVIGKMNQREEVWPLTRQVNQLGETGTFYTRFPLSVVPLPSWEDRQMPDDLEGFLRKSFQDVAVANRDYIKQKVLVIDLNGWGSFYPFELARKIAAEVLSSESSIESVYFQSKSV